MDKPPRGRLRSRRREHPTRRRIGQPRLAAGARSRARERRIPLEYRHDTVGEEAHVDLRLLVRHAAERELGDEVDRKSTRLNSSHVSNSYAVFCLKKKK